ncbi:MAG TPA: hypothetical protein PK358_05695 [Spirochaetota bacterium]|nr:hypothetical protein [Spirochaetota bacterium]
MNRLKYILYTAAAGIILCVALPFVFPFTEEESFTSDYRLPYYLGEDYFLYKKYVEEISSYNTIPVIGDSVIWGHYTSGRDTLTAHLNRMSDGSEFTNLGIDGIHPAVMYGLVEKYCRSLRDKKIIIGINLLWMSSKRHDLTGKINREINHMALLPQFTGRIPSYSPSFEERLSFTIKRNTPFLLWGEHIKLTRFRSSSLYRWSMDNPAANPALFLQPQKKSYELPVPMDPEKFPKQDVRWVAADSSLQWEFTLKTLELLRDRGNKVLAVITPFNRYMLSEQSASIQKQLVIKMEEELSREGITAVIPEIPAKDEFADSSHPTGEGYRTIAEDLLNNREFTDFIKN